MKKGLKILSFKPSQRPESAGLGRALTRGPDGEEPKKDGSQRMSYLRRREQVRKAQKTYRERKEEYVKSLEGQVVQLKANEANIMSETQRLHSEVRMLRKFIADSGLEAPAFHTSSPADALSPGKSSRGSPEMHFFVGDGPTGGRQLHALRASPAYSSDGSRRSRKSKQPPEGLVFEHLSDYETTPSLHSGVTASPDVPPTPAFAEVPTVPRDSSGAAAKVADLDLLAVGIEFVLTLEGPCLDHVLPKSSSPSEPTGHALSATAPILHLPHPTSTTSGGSATWAAPITTLQNLLDLSKELPLAQEAELTPVQVWNALLAHQKFSELDMDDFRALTVKLLRSVKCHRFGAVVEREQFERSCFETFVVGKVFQSESIGFAS